VRTPICGRNFEYYGEDPFHIAKMVVPAVRGIQSQQVAACVKHYAANSQELNRQGVNAQMDERTLREIYLPGFKAAVVHGECLAVMGAYNKFRGASTARTTHCGAMRRKTGLSNPENFSSRSAFHPVESSSNAQSIWMRDRLCGPLISIRRYRIPSSRRGC
jgi:beta-glucosidase-like glycosyl hydrolase